MTVSLVTNNFLEATFQQHSALPIIYIMLIWFQSSRFNPESVFLLTDYISYRLLILMGIFLELGHLIEFGILYLLIILAFLTYRGLTLKIEITAMVTAIIYGVIDEIHQQFTPFRSFSMIDILKDMIGVIVIWWIVRKAYDKKNPSKFGKLLKKVGHMSNRT
ncbi:Predicted integral membrane protein [Bacillus freudenreichii]|nr:Predicted integral membrane protein [Bacillus freudenreichii]